MAILRVLKMKYIHVEEAAGFPPGMVCIIFYYDQAGKHAAVTRPVSTVTQCDLMLASHLLLKPNIGLTLDQHFISRLLCMIIQFCVP